MLSCVIVAQPGWAPRCKKTWLRIGGALFASAGAAVNRLCPALDRFADGPAGDVPAGAGAGGVGCRRLGAYRLRRDPDWFHLCAGLSQLVCSLTNLTELRTGAGHPARGAGLSIVHLYLWPDSEAPQLKPASRHSIAGWRTRPPPRRRRFRWLPCLSPSPTARSAYPPGSRRTAGHVCPPLAPGEKLADARHPRPGREEIARLSEGYRLNAAAGRPDLARCAEHAALR